MQRKFTALLLAAALGPLDGGGAQITATATVAARTVARSCSIEVVAKAGAAQRTREGPGLFNVACTRSTSAAAAVHRAAFYDLIAERSLLASVPQVARPGIDGARVLVVEIMY